MRLADQQQSAYRAAVLKRDEQNAAVRVLKAREQAVAMIVRSLSWCLEVQIRQREMVLKRMMLGAPVLNR